MKITYFEMIWIIFGKIEFLFHMHARAFYIWNSLTKYAFSDKRQGSLACFLCNKGIWAHSKKHKNL